MVVTLNEFAQLLIATLDLLLQVVENVAAVLIQASINDTLITQNANLNFSNVWGVAYGVLVANYWTSQVLVETLNATQYNVYALNNLSLAINYLGSNATVVFGDINANSGIAYIQKGVYQRLTTNQTELDSLALSLSRTFKALVELTIKMAEAINTTFT